MISYIQSVATPKVQSPAIIAEEVTGQLVSIAREFPIWLVKCPYRIKGVGFSWQLKNYAKSVINFSSIAVEHPHSARGHTALPIDVDCRKVISLTYGIVTLRGGRQLHCAENI